MKTDLNKDKNRGKDKEPERCPNCDYCTHCGRSKLDEPRYQYWVYPPQYVYPYVTPYPITYTYPKTITPTITPTWTVTTSGGAAFTSNSYNLSGGAEYGESAA